MRDGEWRLSYSGDGRGPAADLTFGSQASGYFFLTEPEVEYSDAKPGDQDLPGEDGIRMGRDYLGPMHVTFSVGVDTVDRPVPGAAAGADGRDRWNLDAVGRLRQAWRGDAARSGAGVWAVLQCQKAGRLRQIVGRPRRFAPVHSTLYRQGYTPVVMDFQAVDDRWYDAASATVSISQRREIVNPAPPPSKPPPTSPGAKPTPVIYWPPWNGTSDGTTQQVILHPARGSVTVGGDMPTWPVVTLHGPMLNPTVSLGTGWSFGLSMSIADGAWVQVDPRPWRRRVVTNTGASAAHLLTRSSRRLADLGLYPGQYAFAANYAGVDSYKASVTLGWQNAYSWM